MIKVIAIGKLKEKASISLVNEYAKRITQFQKIELIEVPDVKIPDKVSEKEVEQILLKEGKQVLEKIKQDDFMILLDLHGKMYDSESFSALLDTTFTSGKSTITFVIGGSLGVSKELVERANVRWKMSDLTFPHQIVRILLLEQVYRAFTITKGITYHK